MSKPATRLFGDTFLTSLHFSCFFSYQKLSTGFKAENITAHLLIVLDLAVAPKGFAQTSEAK